MERFQSWNLVNRETKFMVEVEKKSLTEKSVKFEKQIPLKRIMIPLLNYTHDVARFKCECTPRIENDIYFSTGIYRFHKKKKSTTCPIHLLRFHTVLSVYFPLEMEIIRILSVWHFKILCSNAISIWTWFFKDYNRRIECKRKD